MAGGARLRRCRDGLQKRWRLMASAASGFGRVTGGSSPGGGFFDQTTRHKQLLEGIEQAALSVPLRKTMAPALPASRYHLQGQQSLPTQSAGTILASLGIRTRAGPPPSKPLERLAEATAWTTRPRLMTITTHGTRGMTPRSAAAAAGGGSARSKRGAGGGRHGSSSSSSSSR